MNTILQKQAQLQDIIAEKAKNFHVNPSNHLLDCGTICNYIKDNAFFMSEEVSELLIEIGGGDRAILKPWSVRHKPLTKKLFLPNDKIKSEAIDILCFCLHICMAAGLTPENINEEYDKVWRNNIKRQVDGY